MFFIIIDEWIKSNPNHLNIFFACAMFFTIVGCLLFINFASKMGPVTEQSNTVLLMVFRSMYVVLLILLGLIILLAPRGLTFFREYLLFCVTLSIFYGGLASTYYYFKLNKK